jgi:predicted nucleotidyltransferase component of viral defense system
MKPLYLRLQEARKQSGVPWDVLERDYLLSWVLAGISQIESLNETLVFKGGTALKKCYFGDYRFSEDLDFSLLEKGPTGDAMEQAIQAACQTASHLLDEFAPVEMVCQRYLEKQPHPGGQEAFSIRAQLPWHRQPQTRVIVEISIDETILRPVERRKIIHGYDEPLDAQIKVYSLEEIVAEKLRAILQHGQRLEERGWSRSRARDYYDLWRILGTFKSHIQLSDFRTLVTNKCAIRNVAFSSSEDFFRREMIAYIEQTWQQWLGPLVPALPPFDLVLSELRPQIATLLETQQR